MNIERQKIFGRESSDARAIHIAFGVDGKPLCANNLCMKNISVDEVWSVAEKILRIEHEH